MTTDLEDRLADAFERVADHTVVDPVPPFDFSVGKRRATRRLLVQAAALVLIAAGTVAVVTVTTRDDDASPAASPNTVAAPPELFTDPAVPIEWTVVEPESSIRHSSVDSIAAGPSGFVAVGMGFNDMSEGQGRVWFSPDGESWTEAAPEVFRRQGIYQVTATSTAYYLYATPTPLTEDASGEPAQLYRSSNGVDWEPIGEPTLDAGQVTAAGDVLLRVNSAAGILTSTDGLAWAPADFAGPNGPASVRYVASPVVVTSASGTFYVVSWDDADSRELWSSTDGLKWRAAPEAAVPGQLVGTSGGLLSLGIANQTVCGTGPPDADPGQVLTEQWTCDVITQLSFLAEGTTEWLPGGAAPRPTPVHPGLTAFGNQLVASVLRPDAWMSVWLSTDGASWTGPVVNARPNDASMTGSPQGFYVSAQNDTTIVIPVAAHGVGDETQLVIGHLAPDGSVGTEPAG